MICDQWEALSKDEKQPFVDAATEDKEWFLREMEENKLEEAEQHVVQMFCAHCKIRGFQRHGVRTDSKQRGQCSCGTSLPCIPFTRDQEPENLGHI